MGASIVTTFTEAISGLATGIATTVVGVFDKVFTTANGELSNIAIYGLVLGGIGLVLGLVRHFTRKAG